MRSHDFRLLSCACVAWAAVAVCLVSGGGATIFVVLGGCCLLGVGYGLWRATGAGLVVALGCATTLVLALTSAGHEFRADTGPIRAWAAQQVTVSAHLVVTKEPIRVAPTKEGRKPVVVVPARLVVVTGRGISRHVDTPVVVVGGDAWAQLHWRSEADVVGQLRPPGGAGPARAMLTARGAPRGVEGLPFPLRLFENLRASLRESFAHTPTDPRGLTPALVDGDVSGLPEDLKDTMNEVGMSHLNAVSGSNVTIVLVACLWLCGLVGCGRRLRLLVGATSLVAFVLVCHPDPSVVRAGAMGAVGLLGTSAGRGRAACPALGAAIVVLLAWDPWLALSAGFALSALATLGLVLFAGPWTSAAMRVLPKWCAKPCELTMIPVAAQAPCLPVLVALNNSVSLVSIPANVAAEPLVAPATLGGMGMLLLSPVPLGMRQLLAWPVTLPAWAIAGIARGAGVIPGGALPWPSGVTGVILAALVVLVPLFAWRLLRHSGRWGLATVVAVVALVAAVLSPLPDDRRAARGWRYAMCDVGQGDGGILSTGQSGHAVAIDVGPADSEGMLRCLDRHGIDTLDAIVLSHFHADHVGALSRVLDEFAVGDVFVTPVREGASDVGHGERGAAPEVDGALARHHKTPQSLPSGASVRIGEIVMEVLWPKRVIHEGSVQNNASLVLDVQAPDLHALFLGDAEKEADGAVEPDVIRHRQQRPYDVVKVGHHGSSNQLATLYVAAQARYGAIGVGADNDYGHPSAKLLRMLDQAHSVACRTDQLGDISFVPGATGLSAASRRSAC